MKKPNFFILGAPKCGTTSLAAWLAEHPQVFFSPVKEPHFFNFDYSERTYRTLRKYERLFSNAANTHIAIGEASTGYLYSRIAVPAILGYTRGARFIVMVRNPIEMAYARHEQLVFDGAETEKDFERAWELQNIRMYGAKTPFNVDPQLLFYGATCCVGAQLARLLEAVPRERVLVINLEDIRSDARREYLKILGFLGLDDDQRQEFPISNLSKSRRFPVLWRGISQMDRILRMVGVRTRLGLITSFNLKARNVRPRPPLSESMKERLRAYFEDDVRLLEGLTGWDLKHWRT